MGKKTRELPITCGVIVTDTRSYLICHPTHSNYWDLPKGKQDAGETLVESAVRELREETGIKVSEQELTYIGTFNYKAEKRLALFYHQVDVMYNVDNLVCTSYFDLYGKKFPEMDKYAVVTSETMLERVGPSMKKVLAKVLN